MRLLAEHLTQLRQKMRKEVESPTLEQVVLDVLSLLPGAHARSHSRVPNLPASPHPSFLSAAYDDNRRRSRLAFHRPVLGDCCWLYCWRAIKAFAACYCDRCTRRWRRCTQTAHYCAFNCAHYLVLKCSLLVVLLRYINCCRKSQVLQSLPPNASRLVQTRPPRSSGARAFGPSLSAHVCPVPLLRGTTSTQRQSPPQRSKHALLLPTSLRLTPKRRKRTGTRLSCPSMPLFRLHSMLLATQPPYRTMALLQLAS